MDYMTHAFRNKRLIMKAGWTLFQYSVNILKSKGHRSTLKFLANSRLQSRRINCYLHIWSNELHKLYVEYIQQGFYYSFIFFIPPASCSIVTSIYSSLTTVTVTTFLIHLCLNIILRKSAWKWQKWS
jgi:hypothetical protein